MKEVELGNFVLGRIEAIAFDYADVELNLSNLYDAVSSPECRAVDLLLDILKHYGCKVLIAVNYSPDLNREEALIAEDIDIEDVEDIVLELENDRMRAYMASQRSEKYERRMLAVKLHDGYESAVAIVKVG